MWSRASMLLLLSVAACERLVGVGDLSGPFDAAPDAVDASLVAECGAQRGLFLVGGNGGLAWFTLMWPVPAVITGFQTGFAYDDPANAKDVTTDPLHPLFARKIGTRALWEGLGANPQPSVFVAGQNETHTNTPSSILVNNMTGLAAAGAAHQTSLHAVVPVLAFSGTGPYGTATGAPTPVAVANVDAAVHVFDGLVSTAIQEQLRPTAAQLALYVPANALNQEINFGSQLAFVANAFRLGLIGTVMMPAFLDDPVGAFDAGLVPGRAANLTAMLEVFETDLATFSEPSCGHAGQPVSLADNVAVIVIGDDPKDSFVANGWPDGTVGNSNWMYLRSNGFTRPGWFGDIEPGARTNFDPATGLLSPAALATTDTAAAFAAALYAIVRGDHSIVSSITPAPFDGLILP